jgi:hypothetical protein
MRAHVLTANAILRGRGLLPVDVSMEAFLALRDSIVSALREASTLPTPEDTSILTKATDRVIIAALIQRVGGRVEFTENEIARAEQLVVERRLGDTLRLVARWGT